MGLIRNLKFLFLIMLLIPLWSFPLNAKIRFLTFHFNQPELIILQNQAFRTFIRDDYEMIVFNDATTDEMAQQIQSVCEKIGVKSIRYEQQWHETDPLNKQIRNWLSNPLISFRGLPDIPNNMLANGSVRHCHVIQYALDHFGYAHDDIVVILDGDLIPIRPISIRALLHNAAIAGSFRGEFLYFWVTFIAMDMPRLPEKEDLRFSVDVINDVLHDSGAHSYYYLKKHQALPIRVFQSIESHAISFWETAKLKTAFWFTDSECQLIKTIANLNHEIDFQVNNHFLHLRASRSDEVMRTKLPIIQEFVLKRIETFQKTGIIDDTQVDPKQNLQKQKKKKKKHKKKEKRITSRGVAKLRFEAKTEFCNSLPKFDFVLYIKRRK